MLHVFVRLATRITMISGGKIFSYSNLNQQEGCLVAGLEMQHKGFHPWSVINVSLATQPKSTHRICFSYMGHFREHITDGVMTCTLLSVSLWWCHRNSFQLNEATVSRENFKKVSWKAKKPKAEDTKTKSFLCSRGKVQSSNLHLLLLHHHQPLHSGGSRLTAYCCWGSALRCSF